MKKTLFFLSVAAVVSLAACQEKPISNESGITSFTATVEQQIEPAGTKTYIDANIVKWSEGDAIKVFYSDGNDYKFNLNGGAGTTTACFYSEDEPASNPQYAIYPYSAGASISGSTISFTLPATQTYAANSFDNGANVAVAQVTGSSMAFKNVCGVLKLSLKGCVCISRIELRSNYSSENLCGTFTVDAGKSNPVAEYSSDGGSTITLDCSSKGGVQLGYDTETFFYFIVPVGSFGSEIEGKGGFTATVYDTAGDTYSTVINTALSSNKINRSRIRSMATKTISLLPSKTSGFKAVEYIKSKGTAENFSVQQYIITDYYGNNTSEVYTDFITNNLRGNNVFGGETSYNTNAFHFYFYEEIGDPNMPSDIGFGTQQVANNDRIGHLKPYLGKHIFFHMSPLGVTIVSEGEEILKKDFSSVTFTSPNALALFFPNRGMAPSATASLMSLYYFKIFESGVVARYFVPCKAVSSGTDANGDAYAANAAGVYDLVNNKFFSNRNPVAGDFTCGDEI